jgi:L-lactate utilization protein LutC
MSIVDDFVANAETAGYTVHRGPPPRIAGAGYSEASYGIADTGSLVFLSSHEPRSASLLPSVHVATLREDRIRPTLADVFADLRPKLPSGVAIVTGPSRSADIEQILAVGVHGPGDVHVVVVPSGTPS